MLDSYPDVVIGRIGGGSNFVGLSFSFMIDKLLGKKSAEFIACESNAVPHTLRGVYTYDFGDTAQARPLAKMMLAHQFTRADYATTAWRHSFRI